MRSAGWRSTRPASGRSRPASVAQQRRLADAVGADDAEPVAGGRWRGRGRRTACGRPPSGAGRGAEIEGVGGARARAPQKPGDGRRARPQRIGRAGARGVPTRPAAGRSAPGREVCRAAQSSSLLAQELLELGGQVVARRRLLGQALVGVGSSCDVGRGLDVVGHRRVDLRLPLGHRRGQPRASGWPPRSRAGGARAGPAGPWGWRCRSRSGAPTARSEMTGMRLAVEAVVEHADQAGGALVGGPVEAEAGGQRGVGRAALHLVGPAVGHGLGQGAERDDQLGPAAADDVDQVLAEARQRRWGSTPARAAGRGPGWPRRAAPGRSGQASALVGRRQSVARHTSRP